MKRMTTALMIAAALAGVALVVPINASAQVSVGLSVNIGPPPLPVYPQPYAPAPGYIWTPGYWGYGSYGYYWVPGTWVLAPAIGLLWTPGWWGWEAGFYRWHPGYWGPHVGYYGGINYGYGYAGQGYMGGYWRGNAFYYNRAVSNVNEAHFHNIYNQPVGNENHVSRVSYNGGEGGIRVQPTSEQQAYARESHRDATAAQMRQEHSAMNNPAQRFTTNHGRPEIAATTRPGKFTGSGVVRMNKDQGAYVYKPGKQKSPGSRIGQPLHPVSQPMEHTPTPEQNKYGNENRAGEGHTMQPENPYGKQSGQPHAKSPESKHPPEHKKNDEDRPPPL
ncbi:MAG: hypothetical protein WBR29_05295 [Gammaproteobacteria bacterium]